MDDYFFQKQMEIITTNSSNDYINSIIQPNNDNMSIKYINCIPKIQYHEYTQIIHNDNSNIIMFVDNDNPEFSNVPRLSLSYLQKQYKLFYVNNILLNNLIDSIIQTTGKYVYPMIFVNYLKQTFKINEKISFDNSLLLYLRIWSNQIRDIVSSNTNQTLSTESKNKIIYIGYKICCELLYYYKYVHH